MTSDHRNAPRLKETLSTTEVAHYCRVSVVHVNRWIKDGKLKSYRYPGGRNKISKKHFREFLENNGIPVIEEFFDDGCRFKVLIGEDDPDFTRGVRMLIESRYPEADIEAAADGYEVLLRMGEYKPDLLILDLKMPRIDGLEVCERLKQLNSSYDCKILAMTGHTQAFSRKKVLSRGADEYLIKPFDSDEFYRIVDRLVGSRKTRSGSD